MEQEEIIINNVEIPVIKEGGKIWYPIKYMGKHVLLKDLTANQLIKNGYGEYIKQFEIEYTNLSKHGGGSQIAYCINTEGLKQILSNCKIARLKVNQKIAMKHVCEYIGLNLDIDTEEKFLNMYPETKWRQYDFWSVECIEAILKEIPDIKWQRCSRCGRYYPYHKCFFSKESNPSNNAELKCVCNNCYKSLKIHYYNNQLLTNTYYKDGIEWYKFIKNNQNTNDIYEYYINNNIKYPNILKNSLLVGNIIIKYYKDYILNNLDQINTIYLSNISKIPARYISIRMIDKNIIKSTERKELLKKIQIEKRLEKIKLKSVAKEFKLLTYEESVQILNDYIKSNNIKINDIYKYNYSKLINKTKVKYYLQQNKIDSLEFIVNYYNWEYAPYKFKTVGIKFWYNKDNVDKTLKYLIEKDLKLPIEKIPLYITKYGLKKYSSSLYNVIYKKRFDNNLYEWINRLYPDKFIEEDFNINTIRNKFDSIEEECIHNLLKQSFKNVIYNNRFTDNKVTIMGMIPDWFVFTDKNIYIVEYFGIALEHNKYNKRISDYIDRSNEKISKYKKLTYAKKIFLYPEDLKNNYDGFYKKIEKII